MIWGKGGSKVKIEILKYVFLQPLNDNDNDKNVHFGSLNQNF